MAIFGRSKKSKATTSLPPQPHSPPLYNQQFSQPGPYATAPQPSWTYVEQRPNTSQGIDPRHQQGWLIAPVPPQYQPVLVHQDQLPPLPQRPHNSLGNLSRLNLSSVTNLLATNVPDCGRIIQNGVSPLHLQGSQYLNQGAALCDLLSSKLDAVITLIDGGKFSGDERELAVFAPPQPMWQQQQHETGYSDRALGKGKSKGMVNNPVSSAFSGGNHFAKVYLYANSRLPPNLPPLKL